MKSVYSFVVTPIGKRYNNVKKVGDKELIINTEIFNHQYVNRRATVIPKPIIGDTDIDVGIFSGFKSTNFSFFAILFNLS